MANGKMTFGEATETEKAEIELNCGYPVGDETVFMARVGKRPVGFVWLGKGICRKIVLSPEARGNGNSEKLLESALKFYFKKHKNVKLTRLRIIYEGLRNGKKREGSLERWVLRQGAIQMRTNEGTHAFVRPRQGETIIAAKKRFLAKPPLRKLRRK
ncbi:MAG: hypothetical protein WCW44_05495 [archaeon]|jgi:hypothetical protein